VTEYQKIPGPFKRYTEGPDRNKLIIGEWSSPELAALKDMNWIWTEKVDGTNIRIIWDGHKVQFGGRTDAAQIPAKLISVLQEMFPEELLEQVFGETAAVLYGEGYGAGIQSGGIYRPDMSFVLFDIRVGKWWLQPRNVSEVADKLGIGIVPVVYVGPVGEAIARVEAGLQSAWRPATREVTWAEGLVGVTEPGLLDRAGNRIIVKIKTKDFR